MVALASLYELTCHHEVKTSHFGGGILRVEAQFPLVLGARFLVVLLLFPRSLFPSAGLRMFRTSISCGFPLRTTFGSLPCSEMRTGEVCVRNCPSSVVDGWRHACMPWQAETWES